MQKIKKHEVQDILALTPLQEGILFHYLMNPASDLYYEEVSLSLEGQVDLERARTALLRVIRTHDILRVVFRWKETKSPVQIIMKENRDADIRLVDLMAEASGGSLEQLRNETRKEIFNLEQRTPFRVLLCRLDPSRYALIFQFHHILFDGWSTANILRDFVQAYHAPGEIQPELRGSFKDYLKFLQSSDVAPVKKFWEGYLENAEVNRLGLQVPDSVIPGAKITDLQLDSGFSDNIDHFLRKHQITFASFMYGVWALVLRQYQANGDVVMGTTVSGRYAPVKDIEKMVGLLINTVPLRVKFNGEQSVVDYLRAVSDNLQSRKDFEHAPLTLIKQSARMGAQEELFESLVVIDNYPLPDMTEDGYEFRFTDYQFQERTNYPMTLNIFNHHGVCIRMSYRDDAYPERMISQLKACLLRCIQQCIGFPSMKLKEMSLMSEADRSAILARGLVSAPRTPENVHGLFDRQAVAQPEKVALICDGKKYTYKTLSAWADQVAAGLLERKLQPGGLVGLVMGRGPEMVVGMLAVLKAGCAFVPVDISQPRDRIRYILADCQVPFVLVNKATRGLCAQICEEIEITSTPAEATNKTYVFPAVGASSLAYAIYTSGSTGRPKGVLIEHGSLVLNFRGMLEKTGITGNPVFLCLTTVSFDPFFLESIMPLVHGHTLIYGTEQERKNPAHAARAIRDGRASVLQFTPSHLRAFLEDGDFRSGLENITHILIGGEEVPADLVHTLKRSYKGGIYNVYGPTETTIWATVSDLTLKDTVDVGDPLPGKPVMILDDWGRVQPEQVKGEILIGGEEVARGYLNNPELTFEKFVQVPYNEDTVFYKTGDVGRWNADGTLDVIGRKDNQVKVRGHRIELGEIEHCLRSHDSVKDGVVIIKTINQDKTLVAYVIESSPGSVVQETIHAHLKAHLPVYMVPSAFVVLKEFPLTPSGKVDRKAIGLLDTTVVAKAPDDLSADALHRKILAVWSEALDKNVSGIHDNFFDLGGNSLQCIRVTSRLNALLGASLEVNHMFEYPTVFALAGFVRGGMQNPESNQVPDALSSTEGDEIAVVGLSCRFPDAENIDAFWENLKNGVSSIHRFTDEELRQAGNEKEIGNASFIRAKGVLKGAEAFDYSFFDYTPAEAQSLDPQIRIFHEVVWEGLESAGYNPFEYRGAIGLYGGASQNILFEINELTSASLKSFSERWNKVLYSDKDFLCTRVSYKLNLRGPAFTVHSACSTSLLAVDVACRDLQTRRCDIAVAGGVSVTYYDPSGYQHSDGMVLSRDGCCRSFDEGASGYVGGNGAGVVVLKRLKEALRDGDHIWAVIKGSAANNDGREKAGFTAPSITGQSEAIGKALQQAGVAPETLGYIEAHGSATPIGDVIEIKALSKAFNTTKRQYCAIGSVKSNIGHLDAAAGIAGLIKTVLSLKHKMIPPSLHVTRTNPNLQIESTPFYVNDSLQQWEAGAAPRRAGVTSLGLGGTNVHVVLEESPAKAAAVRPAKARVLTISARTQQSLLRYAARLKAFLVRGVETLNLDEVCYTLQVSRSYFPARFSAVVTSVEEAIQALEKITLEQIVMVPQDHVKDIVMMFCGQGNQYHQMAAGLYREEPVFREYMDKGLALLEGMLGYDVRPLLYGSPDDVLEINKTSLTQPLLYLVEFSVAQLLLSWGVKPSAMIGHSFGEYSAGAIAGVFSFEDGLRLVTERGRLMQSMPEGSMLSVALSEQEVSAYLGDEIALAAVNTPSSCVLSGSHEAIDRCAAAMEAKGIHPVRLRTSHAGHSHMMEPILGPFRDFASGIVMRPPVTPFISSVSGDWIAAEDATSAAYWSRHIRATVRLSDGLDKILQKDNVLFMEIGPGRSLSTFVRNHPAHRPCHGLFNSVRHIKDVQSDNVFLLANLAGLWMHGGNIAWEKMYAGSVPEKIFLPTYDFEKHVFPVNVGAPGFQKASSPESGEPEQRPAHEWCYVPSWRSSLLPATEAAPANCLMVFADRKGLGKQIVAQAAEQAGRVIIVRAGKKYGQASDNEFTINPGEEAHYTRMFGQLAAFGTLPDAVLHLWSVDERLKNGRKEQEASLYRGFLSLIFLTRNLSAVLPDRTGATPRVRMIAVSEGMQYVAGDESIVPEKSLMRGPVHLISQEFPGFECRSVDIRLRANDRYEKVAAKILRELSAETEAIEIAYRGQERLVRAHERVAGDKSGTMPALQKDGIYLITGGLSGVGYELASSLATQQGVRLLFIGRSPLPDQADWAETGDEKIKNALRLKRLGAEVAYYRGDLSNAGDVNAMAAAVRAQYGSIHGVIHAAGLPGGGMMEVIGTDQINEVISAKVWGTQYLYDAFRKDDLQFFILCSSLNAIAPTQNQVDYAAANMYLDAFAAQAFLQGDDRVLSVNWDRWKGIGMAQAAEEIFTRYAGRELTGGLDARESLDVFYRLLRYRHYQVAVSSVDLEQRIRYKPVIKTEETIGPDTHAPMAMKVRPELSMAYCESRNDTDRKLTDIWKNYFGFDRIGIDDDFYEIGGDSLNATIILSKILKEFNCKLSLRDFLQKLNIRNISDAITGADRTAFYKIEKAAPADHYPLSPSQKRLYFIQAYDPALTAYNETDSFEIKGELDFIRLQSVIQAIVSRHEALRTTFHLIDGKACQRIHAQAEVPVEIVDPQRNEADAVRQFIRPFNLQQDLPIRVGLYTRSVTDHLLIIDIHHIATDGLSQGLLLQDFINLYEQRALKPVTIHPKDYAVWCDAIHHSDALEKQRAYWLSQFGKGFPVLELPLDHRRSEIQNYEGDVEHFTLEETEIKAIQDLAQRYHTTEYMVMLSLYFLFLSKITDQDDIILGIPLSGRNHEALEGVIGMFVNTLPISCTVRGDQSFGKLVSAVSNKTLEAVEHQDYQVDNLVRDLNITRDSSRNPLFDTAFVFHNNLAPDMEVDGLTIRSCTRKHISPKFELIFACYKKQDQYRFGFEYRTGLFRKESIQRFIRFFTSLAKDVCQQPEATLGKARMITVAEEKELLAAINPAHDASYPHNKTIHGLLEENLAIRASKIAIRSSSGSLTYGELHAWADQLAARLRQRGVSAGNIVAIIADRSVEMVVGKLAILKAGAAYLPLSAGYPQKRIEYLLHDSQSECVLVTRAMAPQFDYLGDMLMHIDRQEGMEALAPQEKSETSSKNLAFILYTSGSTGHPKGVMIEHQHFTRWMSHSASFGNAHEDIRFLQTGSPVFDVASYEIWVTLFHGGTVYPVNENELLNVEKLEQFIETHRINTGFFTPALFNQITDQRPDLFSSFSTLILGGDVLSPRHVAKVLQQNPGIRIFNGYGPTENSVFTTGYEIRQVDHRGISIGKPLNQSKVYIVGRHGQLMPVGLPGELYISGKGVSRGYLNKPELTDDRFIVNPFEEDAVCYKTGDIGRWLPDGNIEFFGRRDNQVKVRGFRVELNEIESCLEKYRSIKEVAVQALRDSAGQNYLVAWFTSDQPVDTEDLRSYMAFRLPAYMVPAYFVAMDHMPLSTNGKIDRRNLPVPAPEDQHYAAPVNDLERCLEKVLCQVLNRERVSRFDNFFEIGGDSIKILLVTSNLMREGYQLEVRDLYRCPTIATLVNHIVPLVMEVLPGEALKDVPAADPALLDQVRGQLPGFAVEAVTALSPMQMGMLFHSLYDHQQPVYNVQFVMTLKGGFDPEIARKSLKTIIARHSVLRSIFLHQDQETPMAVVLGYQNNNFKFGDICSLENKYDFAAACALDERNQWFDLSTGPLLRMHILKLDDSTHQLIWTFHHIIMDGWCINIIVNEFFALYGKYLRYEPAELPDAPQYALYLNWLSRLDRLALAEFWTNYLAGFEHPTGVPKKTRKKTAYAPGESRLVIGAADKKALQSFSARRQVTINTALQAIWAMLLSRYNNSRDVLFGAVVSGRPSGLLNMDKMVGLFINTVPLRVRIDGKTTFASIAQTLQENYYTCEPYQYFPLFDIQDCSLPKQNLLDHVFVFENAPGSDLLEQDDFNTSLRGLGMEISDVVNHQHTNYDLTVIAIPVGEEIHIHFKFNMNAYDQDFIENMAGHFQEIQRQAVRHEAIPVLTLDIVPEAEQRVLEAFNRTACDFQPVNSLRDLLQSRMKKDPARIAVEFNDEVISYEVLEKKANQLARYLISQGIGKGDVVGLKMPRSIDLMVCVHAILKAGAAFLPIDVATPQQRMEYLLRNSNASALLTLEAAQAVDNIPVIDVRHAPYHNLDGTAPDVAVGPDDLAYVMYTSGSTGQPKGVMVEHGAVLNTLASMALVLPSEPDDRYLFKTPFIFDVSLLEIFNGLYWGGRVVVLAEGLEKDPYAITDACEKYHITHLFMVSSLFKAWVSVLTDAMNRKIGNLKYLVVGGEVLDPTAVKKFREINTAVSVHNGYGPTEASIFATTYDTAGLNDGASIPIGRPLHNMKMLVLNEQLKLQPVGIEGELFISGPGVARGYINQEILSAERFLPDPFHPGSRMYRTGDIVKWLPSGVVEFTGRKDSQVKVRGQRIELEEIELIMARHEAVKQVAIGLAGKDDDQAICAWYVSAQKPDEAELVSFLAKYLPAYMIPTYFVRMERFPVTPSGKINRRELPVPDKQPMEAITQPTGGLEQTLASIYARVLKRNHVSVNMSFFDMGGNSIKAIYLTSLIQKELEVKVPLARLYESPSVIALGHFVRGLSAGKERTHFKPAEKRPYYNLSPSQHRVYLSQSMDSNMTAYNMCFALDIDASVPLDTISSAVKAIVERHDCFRMSFHMVDGEPVQRLAENVNFGLQVSQDQVGVDEVMKNFVRPFNLTEAPLFRAMLCHHRQERKLLIDIHHIICDGVSIEVLKNEFNTLLSGGSLNPVACRYIDHVAWLNSTAYRKAVASDEKFWMTLFNDNPKPLPLPADYARAHKNLLAGEHKFITLDKPVADQVKVQSRLLGISPFHFTLTVFNILLARLTGQQDITIGVPVTGRSSILMQDVVGMFVNYLPIRKTVDKRTSFAELAVQVKQRVIECLDHQDYPYDALVKKLGLKRVSGHNPLFDVVFNYLDVQDNTGEPEYLKNDSPLSFSAGAKVDLLLRVIHNNGTYVLDFEYTPSLYKEDTIEFISNAFVTTLEMACADAQQPVSSFDLRGGSKNLHRELLTVHLQ